MDKHDDQEGYYSSDDDVAWGPYTLREAKRDLRCPPLKINYRHTDIGLANKCPVQSKPEPASDSSSYFTPDEILAAYRKIAFLEKMEKVLNDGEAGTRINRLDNNQQTLVDDTITEDIDIITISDEDITISDEDSYSVLDISDTSDCSLGSDTEIKIQVESPTQTEIIIIADTFSQKEQSSTSNSNSEQSFEKNNDEVLSKGDGDEVDHALPQKHFNMSKGSSDEFSNEAVKDVLEKRLHQSCRESDMMMMGLNHTYIICSCTNEEMEMMLKYGSNYLMPDKVGAKQNIVHSRVHNKNLLAGKFDYIKSPIAEYIKKNRPIQPLKFKLPEATTRPTTLKLPQNHQFKDIISPIKIYINTPIVCLKRNVVGQVVSQLDLPDASVTPQEDADAPVSADLPEVIYVPSKNVITKTVKQQALPEYIRKLVCTTTIERHDKKTAKLKKEVVREKLLSEDLTSLSFSDPDLYENSKLVDISYVTRKYAFPK